MLNLRFVLYKLIDFYELLIVVECIMSWIPMGAGTLRDIFGAIQQLTEPFVGIFRRLIPSIGGGGVSIDFSPMIAIIALDLLKRLILRI